MHRVVGYNNKEQSSNFHIKQGHIMKKTGLGIVIVCVLAALSSPWWPTSVGHMLYDQANALEAGLAGLETAQVDIGDMSMTVYRRENPGKPEIVLLHGYSADKSVWNRFARHFKDDYALVIPDLAGHGDTGFDASWDYSVQAQSDRVVRLLDALGIQQAHLVGNSMGGFISADFASRYPARTLSATLIDPAGVASPQPSDMEQMLKAGRNPFEVSSREEFDEFFAMTMARPPWFPDIALAAVAEKYQARQSQLRAIFEDFHGQGMLDERLHTIHAPSLILWGAKDRLIHVSSAAVWQEGIPNSELHVWEDIGHMPMMEIPAETADRVKEFLRQHSKA